MRRSTTLGHLAKEAGMDLDEALVTLWENGLGEQLEGPSDVVSRTEVVQAQRVLGIAGGREVARVAYWRGRLGASEAEFVQILSKLEIKISPTARNLPKGAIGKLRRASGEKAPAAYLTGDISEESGPPLNWRVVGRPKAFKCLTVEQLLQIHEALVADFRASDDPIDPPGPRDLGLAASACMRPQTAMGDVRKYESIEMGAAALIHSVVLNHAFHNGNKRTALVAMLTFLDENDLTMTCEEKELFRLVLRIAQHKIVDYRWDQLADREVLAIAEWIRSNSRQIDRGERLIRWYKLRQILASYGCTMHHANVGNRINIEREMRDRKIFGISRPRMLKVQVHYGDEGREVDRYALRHIRRHLELDEANGIDSELFYGGTTPPSDFIQEYRKTLTRLAKL